MREMIQRYGTCALLAWREARVVGQLRFYPIEVARLVYTADPQKQALIGGAGVMAFDPDPATLWVQCVMTSKPYVNAASAVEVGARQGVGQALVRALLAWAGERGWTRIVKQAHADLDCMYGQYGGGGKGFWQKAGFSVVGTHEHAPPTNKEWKQVVEREADAKGVSKQEAWTWYHMAYDLPVV
jgi:GNAT superfamily N-acetyltransferase